MQIDFKKQEGNDKKTESDDIIFYGKNNPEPILFI